MSFTEKHIGKLVKVDRKGLTVEEWCKEYCQSHSVGIDNKMYKNWTECFRNNFYSICADGVQLINGEIYELVEHTAFDECEDLDFFHPLEDGSILFVTEFHNGGTCLEEVLDSGVTRVSKKLK